MKKYLFSMLALATMFFVACSEQDDFRGGDNAGDYVEAGFTINAPMAMGTRAIGDGTTANVVACAVFNADGDELTDLRINDLAVTGKKATYNVRLAKGQKYRVVFFAYNSTSGAYNIDDMKNIVINDQNSNVEAYDAFTAYVDVTAAESMNPINKEVVLYRPFAQLNLGSLQADIDAARKSGIIVEETEIIVDDVYTAFNAYDDMVAGDRSTRTYKMNAIPTEVLKANDGEYKYLALNYLLVGDKDSEKSLVDVTFKWVAENGKTNDPVTVWTSVPVQRNYRTNILGYLLTNPAEFNIVIDERFNEPDYNEPWVGDVKEPAYDAATQTYTIMTPEELAWVSQQTNGAEVNTRANAELNNFAGYTIQLGADIDLNGYNWIPIGSKGDCYKNGFRGTFDGAGYSISNMSVLNTKYGALIGMSHGATIKNVTLKNVDINTHHYAGAILAWGESSTQKVVIENCHVNGGKIVVTPELIDGNLYDNGDKAGGIAGFLYAASVSNCSATDIDITAYRDLGGIAGYVSKTTLENVSVEGLTIAADQSKAPYNGAPKAANLGTVIGRNGGENTVDGMLAYTVKSVAELQAALDADAEGDKMIYFGANIAGDPAIVTEKAGVNIVIDGCNYKYDGQIKIKGMSTKGNETLVIKNINFETSTASREFIWSNDSSTGSMWRYANNVTVENCTFTANGAAVETVVGIKFQQAYNIAIKSCTATGVHSLAQIQSYDNTLLIEDVTVVAGKNGISLGNSANVTINGADIEAKGYGIRADGNANRGNLVVENATIKANEPIVVRKATTEKYALELGNNVVLNSTGVYEVVFTTGDDSETPVAPAEANYSYESASSFVVFPLVNDATEVTVTNGAQLALFVNNGKSVTLESDCTIDKATSSNAYGTTGINVKNGQTIDGGGNVLAVKGAGGTWDSGISTTGGLIKNITITGSFRGIFINHNSSHSEPVILENVIFDGTTYTISCDQGSYQNLEAYNCTFNGWTSYAATIGNVYFEECSFGYGAGYKFCRPYAPTEFVGCEFEAGFTVDPRAAVTFENCTIDGVALTADNLSTLVTASNIANATVK